MRTSTLLTFFKGTRLQQVFLAVFLIATLWEGILCSGISQETSKSLGFTFTNIATKAGLDAPTVFGGKQSNKYLLETTGCGVAFLDYDNDGWLDVFLVNGFTLEGFPKGQE